MKPTHLLKVKEREGEGKTTIGAGWMREDGSVSIKLSPCAVLSWQDNVIINLFPIDDDGEPTPDYGKKRAGTYRGRKPGAVASVGSYAIPAKDAKGHTFACIHNDGKTAIFVCSACNTRVVTNVPYDGILVDYCPKSGTRQHDDQAG
jgi:hypothetical protein